jgi:hypothetical protein
MNIFLPLAIIAVATATLLVFAGRESLRVRGDAPLPVRRPTNLVTLIRIGWTALNQASAEAARLGIRNSRW